MNVLLLNPQPDRDILISRDHMGGFGFEVKSTNMIPPLNLAYCAAVLEKNGIGVKIMDAVALGLKPGRVLDYIREQGFDLVAVNTATPSITDDLAMADSIKEVSPQTFVALLGPHVSAFAEDALRECRADAVVRGEPEYTLAELAHKLARESVPGEIRGLTMKAGGEIKRWEDRPFTEDLDAMPFPARHLLPMGEYRSAVWGKQPFTTMLTSRGCFYGCGYCPYPIGHGTRWRARSAQNVVDEIEECVRKHGVREILFRDPLFTGNRERAVEICELMIARGLKVDWRCETRADLASEEMIDAFARAGCREINFGVESGSRHILEGIRRVAIPPERIREIFQKCRSVNIETMAFFIIGLPGETRETVEQTVRLALELNPDVVQFTAATPYPETPYYEQLKREGMLMQDWSLFTSRAPVLGTKELNPENLRELIERAYRRFYFRPRYLLTRLGRLRSTHEITRAARGLLSALKYAGLSR